MNDYDSAKMADVLAASHGYARTQNPDEADLLLLNTCSVREKAQEKVFSELGRWRDWKAADPARVIGVGGCVASTDGEAIARRATIVDLAFGPPTDRKSVGEGKSVSVRVDLGGSRLTKT